ncbi:MAG: response regulator [Rickettsia endosymbiont of Ixodes persulcatus]|nr:response regulator [Rickettsia endosymbiont of Ixodes persulcatus]
MERQKQQITEVEKGGSQALLVEDEAICQKLLENHLLLLDYQIDIVKEARAAIQAINNKLYDLIIIDLGLPDQPGETVIEAIQQCDLNQQTPVIVCTAHADQKIEKKCLALGADKVLIKPILFHVLQETIKQGCLIPSYRKKYKFQLKLLQQQVETLLQQKRESCIAEVEEREIFHQLRIIAQRLIKVVDEYHQGSTNNELSNNG